MPNQIEMPPMPADPSAAVRPWGFWATLGWTLLAIAAGLLAMIAVGNALVRWDTSLNVTQILLRRGQPHRFVAADPGYGVLIAVLIFAAKRSGWSATAYLALVRPRGRYVLCGALVRGVPAPAHLRACAVRHQPDSPLPRVRPRSRGKHPASPVLCSDHLGGDRDAGDGGDRVSRLPLPRSLGDAARCRRRDPHHLGGVGAHAHRTRARPE